MACFKLKLFLLNCELGSFCSENSKRNLDIFTEELKGFDVISSKKGVEARYQLQKVEVWAVVRRHSVEKFACSSFTLSLAGAKNNARLILLFMTEVVKVRSVLV